jgi:hypothetical protein
MVVVVVVVWCGGVETEQGVCVCIYSLNWKREGTENHKRS